MTQQTNPSDTVVLSDILHELRMARTANADLWDVGDIADYLKMSKSHASSRVICQKKFPKPYVIPTTQSGGAKRWAAKEVKDWVKKFRKIS